MFQVLQKKLNKKKYGFTTQQALGALSEITFKRSHIRLDFLLDIKRIDLTLGKLVI